MTVYINPPFGNYIKRKDCISIKGTFTWDRRPGLIMQTMKTLRKIPGGWVNSIGFRNKGMRNIKECDKKSIYSIAALDGNWLPFYENIPRWSRIEINLGCPNVSNYTMTYPTLKKFCNKFPILSVKVNPYIEADEIVKLYESGVKTFHLSNTIPSERGGISGDQLREQNLKQVEMFSNLNLIDTGLIVGGGIYKPDHVRQYRDAGALNDFSLSTIWFTPWLVPAVIKEIKKGWVNEND